VHLLRYRDSSSGVMGIGVLRRDTISAIKGVTSLAQLWRLSREELKAAVTGATGAGCMLADVTVAAPVDRRTEVWACGVTYEISREARTEEFRRCSTRTVNPAQPTPSSADSARTTSSRRRRARVPAL
jgi:2-dehydro-3-deoxy-D-arabinonate dehydratase